MTQFLELFPRPGRVLELGCLEGGHTVPIARQADEVVAIEARAENLARARWIADVLQQTNIQFVQANLEECDLSVLGRFDVAFNVGLLYHLPRPWRLVRQLANVAATMYLWTHVAFEERADAERGGYAGAIYREFGVRDPLSGLSGDSFWPTRESLVQMLHDGGFADVAILGEDRSHRHGAAVTLRCRSLTHRTTCTGAGDSDAHAKVGSASDVSTGLCHQNL